MKISTTKPKTLLIIIFALFTAFVIGWMSLFRIIQSPENAPEQSGPTNTALITTSLIIDYGGEKANSYVIELPLNSSAFNALQKAAEIDNITLETQQYDFGIFVKSIEGFESTAEVSWIYFVNGESGMVAADKLILIEGDTVEWKFIKPE